MRNGIKGIKMRRGDKKGEQCIHMSSRKGLNEHNPLMTSWGNFSTLFHSFPLLLILKIPTQVMQ